MSQRHVRRSAWVMTTAIMLGAALLAWKGEEDGATGQSPTAPKARPAGKPVVMPTQAISLLVALGLEDNSASITWKGAVRVSEGKVRSLDLLQGKGQAKGDHFSVSSFIAK